MQLTEIQPIRITSLPATRLVGIRTTMSFAENKTRSLWQRFMPLRSTINGVKGNELYSVEFYPSPAFFSAFDPTNLFEKWAAVAVEESAGMPDEMEELHIPQGDYAVFLYRGKPSEAQATFQYIYASWLPQSPYELDDRPHFAKMGEGYKGEDPDSEEEFWIPIKK
jgi:AraC family transcriptional regulator